MKPVMSVTSAIFSLIRRFWPSRPTLPGKAATDPNEIIRALAAVATRRHADPIVASLQDRHTPLDFADALTRADTLSYAPRSLLVQSPTAKSLSNAPPETYRRFEITRDVVLYRDPAFPADRKKLLFVFGGGALRPMMPIAAFLQLLPAGRFDMVMLGDRANLAFEAGIPNYAATLPELVARLASDTGRSNYERLVTVGMSGGGLPALRAGILLEAERSIAFGPRFNWHVGRLLKGTGAIPAFDLLCACTRRGRTRLFAVCAESNATDVHDIQRLARILPVETRLIAGTDKHNFVHSLAKVGRFRDLLLGLLEK